VLYAAAFYPGGMGFDVAYQWWQSRGGETTNIHGLGMIALWRVADLFNAGPGFLFLSQLIVLFAGVLMVAHTMSSRRAKILMLVAIFISPICFVELSTLTSDVMLAAMLCLALGMIGLVDFTKEQSRGTEWMALLPLFFALMLRKNALPGVVPLVVYAVYVAWKAQAGSASLKWSVLASVPLVGAMLLINWMFELQVDRRVSVFPATQMWDLAAVSVEANKILLPPGTYGPGLTIDDLRQAIVPYTNTTLFEKTHAGMRQPFFGPGDPLNEEIRNAWIEAILAYPAQYFEHRWRVTQYLFGTKSSEWPRELVYSADQYHYRDNPSVSGNTTTLHQYLLGLFERLRPTVLLAPWPYLLCSLAAIGLAWRRKSSSARAAIAASASGLLYALPLPIISPSAELRYLLWTCLSGILSLALALNAWGAARRS